MTFFAKCGDCGYREKTGLVKTERSTVCSVPDTGYRPPHIDPDCAEALGRPAGMDHVGIGRCLVGKRHSHVPLRLEGLRLNRV